jgi:flagellar basal body rod protein FlgG
MTALTIAVSALLTQQTNVAVIADNIANSQTPDYAPRQTNIVSTDPGVTVGSISRAPVPEVDVAHELVGLMMARTAYEATLKVVSASDRMSGDLLASV